jgi:hypothetical protein
MIFLCTAISKSKQCSCSIKIPLYDRKFRQTRNGAQTEELNASHLRIQRKGKTESSVHISIITSPRQTWHRNLFSSNFTAKKRKKVIVFLFSQQEKK